MTPVDTPLEGFEARLLDALQDEIRGTAAQRQPGRHRSRPRKLIACGVAACVLAIAAFVAPVLAGQHSTSRAYAVTTAADGKVTATIYRFNDATGLQAQLAEAGITAVVQYAPPGEVCATPTYPNLEDALPDNAVSVGLGGGQHQNEYSVTTSPTALKGLTLVVTLVKTGGASAPVTRTAQGLELVPATGYSLKIGVTNKRVGSCTLIADDHPVPTPK